MAIREARIQTAHDQARELAQTWEVLGQSEVEAKEYTDTYAGGARFGAQRALTFTDEDIRCVAIKLYSQDHQGYGAARFHDECGQVRRKYEAAAEVALRTFGACREAEDRKHTTKESNDE